MPRMRRSPRRSVWVEVENEGRRTVTVMIAGKTRKRLTIPAGGSAMFIVPPRCSASLHVGAPEQSGVKSGVVPSR